MAWLHTWSALLPGWLLFVVFLFGTTAFFQHEISRWMQPEVGAGNMSPTALDSAVAHLRNNASTAEIWNIALPRSRSGGPVTISWESAGRITDPIYLDPVKGSSIDLRETFGGAFLYRFHFDLHYVPWWFARYLVCFAALAMLISILSGVLTHKKIFADFFMLRIGKAQRSWLDAHNIFAVLPLPFHLMITYTGLVTLLFTLMPWAISANAVSQSDIYRASYYPAPDVVISDRPASMLPLGVLINRAQTIWQGDGSDYVSIRNPDSARAVITIWPSRDRIGSPRQPVYLNGTTGEQLPTPQERGSALATQHAMVDLHTGTFAGTALRWLYFLSGVAGTLMVATGLVLWTVKRRAKLPDPTRPYFGFRLVQRLNIGVIVGAPLGIAIYFLANRLLPLEMSNRADWEVHSLFIAWGGALVWAVARPARHAWVEALAACAALYALVPVVNAMTTVRGLIPSLIARDWVFVSFDLTMLVTAAACALAAWKAASHKPKMAIHRKARERVEAVV